MPERVAMGRMSWLCRRLLPGLLLCGPVPWSTGAAAQSSFREGSCSGVLCDYIGGAQAPAAQARQTSLFREGECGGILCDAIGGAQAPKVAYPPPPCGGGLLCDLAPYKMGVPLSAAEAAQLQAQRDKPPVPTAPDDETSRRKPHKSVRGAVAKAIGSKG